MGRSDEPRRGLRVSPGVVGGACCVGVFLGPLRVAGVPVPLGPALAITANVALVRAGTRVCGNRWGGAGSFMVWVLFVATFASPHHGSVLLPASAMGYAYLLSGAVSGAAALALGAGPARPADRA